MNTDTTTQQEKSEIEVLRSRVAELEKLNSEYKKEKNVLEEAGERLEIIVKNTNDIIFQLSPLGVIQYVSPNVKEIYGYKPEELTGKHLKKTTPLSELPKAIEVLKRVLSGEVINHFKINQQDANGRVVIVEINLSPVRKDGKIVAVGGVIRNITERQQVEEEEKKHTEQLVNAMEKTISAMAMIIEMRDPYTAGHQRRVTQLACAIAEEMGLSENQITGLRLAGLIHDIGKVRVPAEILTNPDGLSDAEFALIKMHPVLGYEILKTMDLPWPIADIIYQHHERINGSGYPLGLSAKDIILEAKILAVADVFEAISSHRPYRPAHGVEIALNEISQKKGKLYDSKVVDACLEIFTNKGFKFIKISALHN